MSGCAMGEYFRDVPDPQSKVSIIYLGKPIPSHFLYAALSLPVYCPMLEKQFPTIIWLRACAPSGLLVPPRALRVIC